MATVLVLLATGCGSGTLPRAEYAERAASICATLATDVEAVGRSVNPETGGGLLGAGVAANELRRQAVEDLKALGDPDTDADTARAMVAAMEAQVDRIEASNEALAGGDPARMAALLEEAGEAGREAKRLAGEFGIAPCAR